MKKSLCMPALHKQLAVMAIAGLAISPQASALTAASPVAAVPSSFLSDSSATSIHIPVTQSTAFSQVTAGNYYSVGLRADGSVWTWGRNLYGELGITDTTATSNMIAPVRLSTLSEMTSIASNGNGYQLGVRKDGSVWEWGNRYSTDRESQPPRQLPQISDVSQVSTLNEISFALTKDGTVKAWMRDHETGESSRPVQVEGLRKIVQLDAAAGKGYALDSSGSVWIFSAELKDKQLNLSSPSQIYGLPPLKQIYVYNSTEAYGVDAAGSAWKWSITNASSVIKLSGKASKIYPQLKVKSIQAANGYAVLLTRQGEVWTYGKKPAGKEGKVKELSGIVSISAGDTHCLAIDSKGQVWGWGANQWNEIGVPRNSGDGMEYVPVRIQTPITVVINGKLLPASFPAMMNNNLISVPLKSVVKELGASLDISPVTNGSVYTMKHQQNTVTFQIGSTEAELNGQKLALSSPAYLITGATMIPASLLKQMGIQVVWDSKLSTLSISSS
ncbi:stalk domain-containing protein [Paenibacillus sp. KQZ6P-2]|uniref:Stalk domain-containing protein n=1 Tax=Paenibacillus mangrovi TaxID=2931978 RepID=A0A9X2B6D3_9BACL|nr:stalk domain-containing protein [Paenibacillus mangrovi]MCJ8013682.1 stalk domain-containing protein [Paenibacillus mangrovi]